MYVYIFAPVLLLHLNMATCYGHMHTLTLPSLTHPSNIWVNSHARNGICGSKKTNDLTSGSFVYWRHTCSPCRIEAREELLRPMTHAFGIHLYKQNGIKNLWGLYIHIWCSMDEVFWLKI